MIEENKDWFSKLTDVLSGFRNPLILTFFCYWLVFNWKVVVVLISSDDIIFQSLGLDKATYIGFLFRAGYDTSDLVSMLYYNWFGNTIFSSYIYILTKKIIFPLVFSLASIYLLPNFYIHIYKKTEEDLSVKKSFSTEKYLLRKLDHEKLRKSIAFQEFEISELKTKKAKADFSTLKYEKDINEPKDKIEKTTWDLEIKQLIQDGDFNLIGDTLKGIADRAGVINDTELNGNTMSQLAWGQGLELYTVTKNDYERVYNFTAKGKYYFKIGTRPYNPNLILT
jgi:hypothetical protein